MDIINCNSLILCHWLVTSVCYNIAQLIIKPHLATRLRRCGLLLQMNLRAWPVCRSVIILSPAKQVTQSRYRFGLWTQVGPGNYVLDEGSDPHAKGQFWGVTLSAGQMAG